MEATFDGTMPKNPTLKTTERIMADPDYCENKCPICTKARKGNRLAKIVQRIEMLVTFGRCPHGRARRRKYGVRPDEPLPARKNDSGVPRIPCPKPSTD